MKGANALLCITVALVMVTSAAFIIKSGSDDKSVVNLSECSDEPFTFGTAGMLGENNAEIPSLPTHIVTTLLPAVLIKVSYDDDDDCFIDISTKVDGVDTVFHYEVVINHNTLTITLNGVDVGDKKLDPKLEITVALPDVRHATASVSVDGEPAVTYHLILDISYDTRAIRVILDSVDLPDGKTVTVDKVLYIDYSDDTHNPVYLHVCVPHSGDLVTVYSNTLVFSEYQINATLDSVDIAHEKIIWV